MKKIKFVIISVILFLIPVSELFMRNYHLRAFTPIQFYMLLIACAVLLLSAGGFSLRQHWGMRVQVACAPFVVGYYVFMTTKSYMGMIGIDKYFIIPLVCTLVAIATYGLVLFDKDIKGSFNLNKGEIK